MTTSCFPDTLEVLRCGETKRLCCYVENVRLDSRGRGRSSSRQRQSEHQEAQPGGNCFLRFSSSQLFVKSHFMHFAREFLRAKLNDFALRRVDVKALLGCITSYCMWPWLYCLFVLFTFCNNISYTVRGPYSIKRASGVPTNKHTRWGTQCPEDTNSHTQQLLLPQKARLQQDDSRPLSSPDKNPVSWDDVTTAFLMGVNLCQVVQRQKNLCAALGPHVLERMEAVSALFCFSSVLPLFCLFSVFQDAPPDPPVTDSLSLSSLFSAIVAFIADGFPSLIHKFSPSVSLSSYRFVSLWTVRRSFVISINDSRNHLSIQT